MPSSMALASGPSGSAAAMPSTALRSFSHTRGTANIRVGFVTASAAGSCVGSATAVMQWPLTIEPYCEM
jgi:histidinol-phosphate/aromatic aminotransferase/cobyric acid decarboxylase-like protein